MLPDTGETRHPRATPTTTTTTTTQPPPKLSEPLPCPRCSSTNTKFCYYNNYNLSQPRHFCKSCRRYWTHGGTLRNVPLGGSSRKHSSKRQRRPEPPPSRPEPVPPAPEPAPAIATPAEEVHGGFQESGSFLSLLGDQSGDPGFLGFGGLGFGFGSGSGSGFEEMGLGFGCDTWQSGEVEGGETLLWPGLEVSMGDKSLK